MFDFRTEGGRLKFDHARVGGASNGEWTLTGVTTGIKFSNSITEIIPQTSVRLHVDVTTSFDRNKVKRVDLSKKSKLISSEVLPSGVYSVEGPFPTKEKSVVLSFFGL